MNFVGYTYKADVEAEKQQLVNVLKELDSANDQQFEDGQAVDYAAENIQSNENIYN